jgi:acylphosphatase
MNRAQRIHVLYSGQVHGVGFRFTAERIALSSGITGFAKNLTDGTVEIVGEGNQDQLEIFLQELKNEMRGHISDSRVDWEPGTGEFSSFEIRF